MAVLAVLYATGARKVPAGSPTGFVPTRYLDAATTAGDVTGYRHYWELCMLMVLRDGLRSGDVHVPGSRRYADPAAFLLTLAHPRSTPRTGFLNHLTHAGGKVTRAPELTRNLIYVIAASHPPGVGADGRGVWDRL